MKLVTDLNCVVLLATKKEKKMIKEFYDLYFEQNIYTELYEVKINDSGFIKEFDKWFIFIIKDEHVDKLEELKLWKIETKYFFKLSEDPIDEEDWEIIEERQYLFFINEIMSWNFDWLPIF